MKAYIARGVELIQLANTCNFLQQYLLKQNNIFKKSSITEFDFLFKIPVVNEGNILTFSEQKAEILSQTY
jgi:hypothetical protein